MEVFFLICLARGLCFILGDWGRKIERFMGVNFEMGGEES